MSDSHAANVAGIKRFLSAIEVEARANPEFAARLAGALSQQDRMSADGAHRPGPAHRRKPGPIDPFEVHAIDGEPGLRAALAQLDVDQLKDVVAEHGMDRTKLAMRWKTTDRLVDLIVETVDARARKGDAFRSPAPDRRAPAETPPPVGFGQDGTAGGVVGDTTS